MHRILKQKTPLQYGFTVVELIIVLALVGILGTAIVFSITNTFGFSRDNINLNTAINNVRYAGEWLSKDIRGGGTIVTPDVTGTLSPGSGALILKWRDIQNTDHEITYLITETGVLQRTYDTGTMVIANSITGINYSIDDININLSITATVKEQSYTKVYLATIRN